MKQKGEDFFSLLVVVTCVLASALLLRTLFGGSLEAYTNQVQTGAQTEHLRPPLQETEAGESKAPDGFPMGNEAGEMEDYGDSPMRNDMYLAGYSSYKEADTEIVRLCFERYGEFPLAITKAYMESGYAYMGYAWYGVAQMQGNKQVIFHYNGLGDIWTQRNNEAPVYNFIYEQTEDTRQGLQNLVLGNMGLWIEEGYADWEN